MKEARAVLIWVGLLLAVTVPIAAAAASPLLAWRSPVYIAAGFAGVLAMTLLLIQPLLAGRDMPGLSLKTSRKWHRLGGVALVFAVFVHVAGLWITSPPDVIDALLFTSPTPFSAWGVVAMWAVFATALLALLRRRIGLDYPHWRMCHTGLAGVTIIGSVVHALLIEGTMEIMTKSALCILVVLASVRTLARLRVWSIRTRSRP